MFQLRDLLGAHFQGRARASRLFDDVQLPAWLDRRLHWNAATDRRRLERAERSNEPEPVGKDPRSDY